MNTNNSFEVKYTIRLYDPALISELAVQFEKAQKRFGNKNEFFTHIIEIGLNANRKENKAKPTTQTEDSDIYQLLQKIFNYTSSQFRKIYIDINVMQKLLSVCYKILLALNKNEKLFAEKIEDGFYDELPSRFADLIESLIQVYGLK